MGNFNTVHVAMACPRCGAEDVVEVELRLGNTANMMDLRLGDRYPWVAGQRPEDGGRPEGGNTVGDGYMECNHCHKDAFVHVSIYADVIAGVVPNRDKSGYIAD